MLDMNAVKIDLEKLDGGCWWEIRMEGKRLAGDPVDKPSPDATAVLIVPIGVGYQRQLAREEQGHLTELRRDDLCDKERHRLECLIGGTAVAKKVLRGWQNMGFGDGEVPYSETEAIRVLTMRSMRNLLDFCVEKASEQDATLAREEAQAVKN